jgi:hypothetical protein
MEAAGDSESAQWVDWHEKSKTAARILRLFFIARGIREKLMGSPGLGIWAIASTRLSRTHVFKGILVGYSLPKYPKFSFFGIGLRKIGLMQSPCGAGGFAGPRRYSGYNPNNGFIHPAALHHRR